MRHLRIPKPESVSLSVAGKTITGIRHRVPNEDVPVKALCLHGWLDNANSFVPLMPLLPNIDLVAIDLPGHGFSEHLDSTYTVPDSAYWAAATMKALEWEQCHLIGHSLGGIIAPLLAVGVPECVQSMVLIESSGALTSEADTFVKRLQRSLSDQLDNKKYASRTYKSKDDAIASRLRAAKMNTASAKLIIDRQLAQFEDGWRWRFDSKLRVSTAHRLTEAHVRDIHANIECPVLSVIAEDGFLTSRDDTEERMALIKNLKTVSLPGHHHVHMDTPEPVAAAINQFLGTTPALGG